MRLFALTGVALLVSTAVFAQDVGVGREKQQQDETLAVLKKQMAETRARVPIETPITGAPYSADVVTESSQTLADGNHISRKMTGHVYRDSAGRIRREQEDEMPVLGGTGSAVEIDNTISIVDPVAGYAYSLDPRRKIAWRTPMATGAALQGDLLKLKERMDAAQIAAMKEQAAAARGRPELPKDTMGRGEIVDRADGSVAPLEHKTIDGIPVDGRVSTKVIPAGAIGNDRPLTITSEEWTSPDLHVMVMTRHNDPRTGETIYRLTNIVRAEPDPSLFMVPPDYTVKDTGIKRPGVQ